MTQDILVVDDEADIRELVSGILEDEGYNTRVAADGPSALASIKFRQPTLVLLDVWLNDGDRDGIKILENISRDHPHVPVVMMSGHSTIETAVAAIKRGAYDFIEKPFETERLLLAVQRALENARLRRENADLRTKTGAGELKIVGNSPVMGHIRQLIEKSAVANSRIFLSGPAGSGKETIARKIHSLSKRADGPFLVFNCATLHPDQLESELFGTEIVGMDPTMPRKIGMLEKAHGGILYLDEVTDLPLALQGKLVRILQENSFTRLGSNQRIDVDVRIIASTTRAMAPLIREGKFREDLFYRLSVVPLEIPSLADRITDLPELISYFVTILCSQHGCHPRTFSEEAIVSLQAYHWPGNVRQLKNVIEWVLIMTSGDPKAPVTAAMLPPEIRGGISGAETNPSVIIMPLREAREAFEREYLMAQVNRFGGNISKTAKFVGMERSALHRKLRALGVGESREKDEDNSTDDPHDPTVTKIA